MLLDLSYVVLIIKVSFVKYSAEEYMPQLKPHQNVQIKDIWNTRSSATKEPIVNVIDSRFRRGMFQLQYPQNVQATISKKMPAVTVKLKELMSNTSDPKVRVYIIAENNGGIIDPNRNRESCRTTGRRAEALHPLKETEIASRGMKVLRRNEFPFVMRQLTSTTRSFGLNDMVHNMGETTRDDGKVGLLDILSTADPGQDGDELHEFEKDFYRPGTFNREQFSSDVLKDMGNNGPLRAGAYSREEDQLMLRDFAHVKQRKLKMPNVQSTNIYHFNRHVATTLSPNTKKLRRQMEPLKKFNIQYLQDYFEPHEGARRHSPEDVDDDIKKRPFLQLSHDPAAPPGLERGVLAGGVYFGDPKVLSNTITPGPTTTTSKTTQTSLLTTKSAVRTHSLPPPKVSEVTEVSQELMDYKDKPNYKLQAKDLRGRVLRKDLSTHASRRDPMDEMGMGPEGMGGMGPGGMGGMGPGGMGGMGRGGIGGMGPGGMGGMGPEGMGGVGPEGMGGMGPGGMGGMGPGGMGGMGPEGMGGMGPEGMGGMGPGGMGGMGPGGMGPEGMGGMGPEGMGGMGPGGMGGMGPGGMGGIGPGGMGGMGPEGMGGMGPGGMGGMGPGGMGGMRPGGMGGMGPEGMGGMGPGGMGRIGPGGMGGMGPEAMGGMGPEGMGGMGLRGMGGMGPGGMGPGGMGPGGMGPGGMGPGGMGPGSMGPGGMGPGGMGPGGMGPGGMGPGGMGPGGMGPGGMGPGGMGPGGMGPGGMGPGGIGPGGMGPGGMGGMGPGGMGGMGPGGMGGMGPGGMGGMGPEGMGPEGMRGPPPNNGMGPSPFQPGPGPDSDKEQPKYDPARYGDRGAEKGRGSIDEPQPFGLGGAFSFGSQGGPGMGLGGPVGPGMGPGGPGMGPGGPAMGPGGPAMGSGGPGMGPGGPDKPGMRGPGGPGIGLGGPGGPGMAPGGPRIGSGGPGIGPGGPAIRPGGSGIRQVRATGSAVEHNGLRGVEPPKMSTERNGHTINPTEATPRFLSPMPGVQIYTAAHHPVVGDTGVMGPGGMPPPGEEGAIIPGFGIEGHGEHSWMGPGSGGPPGPGYGNEAPGLKNPMADLNSAAGQSGITIPKEVRSPTMSFTGPISEYTARTNPTKHHTETLPAAPGETEYFPEEEERINNTVTLPAVTTEMSIVTEISSPIIDVMVVTEIGAMDLNNTPTDATKSVGNTTVAQLNPLKLQEEVAFPEEHVSRYRPNLIATGPTEATVALTVFSTKNMHSRLSSIIAEFDPAKYTTHRNYALWTFPHFTTSQKPGAVKVKYRRPIAWVYAENLKKKKYGPFVGFIFHLLGSIVLKRKDLSKHFIGPIIYFAKENAYILSTVAQTWVDRMISYLNHYKTYSNADETDRMVAIFYQGLANITATFSPQTVEILQIIDKVFDNATEQEELSDLITRVDFWDGNIDTSESKKPNYEDDGPWTFTGLFFSIIVKKIQELHQTKAGIQVLNNLASYLAGRQVTVRMLPGPRRAAHSWTKSFEPEHTPSPTVLSQVQPTPSLEGRLRSLMHQTFNKLKEDYNFVRKNKTSFKSRKVGIPPALDETKALRQASDKDKGRANTFSHINNGSINDRLQNFLRKLNYARRQSFKQINDTSSKIEKLKLRHLNNSIKGDRIQNVIGHLNNSSNINSSGPKFRQSNGRSNENRRRALRQLNNDNKRLKFRHLNDGSNDNRGQTYRQTNDGSNDGGRRHVRRKRHKRHSYRHKKHNRRKRHRHDSSYRIRKPTYHRSLKKQVERKIHKYEHYMENLDRQFSNDHNPDEVENYHNIARDRHRARKHTGHKSHHKRKSHRRKHHSRHGVLRRGYKHHGFVSEENADSQSRIGKKRFEVINKGLRRYKRQEVNANNHKRFKYHFNVVSNDSMRRDPNDDHPEDIASDKNAFREQLFEQQPYLKPNIFRSKKQHESAINYRRFISFPIDTDKYDVYKEEYNSNSTGKIPIPTPFLKQIQKNLFKHIKKLSHDLVRNVKTMAANLTRIGKSLTNLSSDVDDEHILKDNIYKAFGYRRDFIETQATSSTAQL